MFNQRMRLAVIIGSGHPHRRGGVIAGWFVELARACSAFEVKVIDVADASLPRLAAEFSEQLQSADAFVVVTPEHNHGYPAALKGFIDAHYTEWRAKPVGFISYGGLSGGLRAVEQLRQVFVELHTVSVRESVAFPNVQSSISEAGEMYEMEGPQMAGRRMLEQLDWWAWALKSARQEQSYAA